MVGAYAGNRLGAIRDAKGKSVAAVFAQLGGSQKAEVCSMLFIKSFSQSVRPCPQILRALAAKVLGAAASQF